MMRDEVGDCIWYATRINDLYCDESIGNTAIQDYTRIVYGDGEFTIYSIGRLFDHIDSVNIFPKIEAGVDKVDGSIDLDFCIIKVFRRLFEIGNNYGFTLEDAARANMAKLQSRKERGVITGKGGKR
jgi:hypothetical protein